MASEQRVDTVTSDAAPASPLGPSKANASEELAGYDCDFVSSPPEVLPSVCSICLHIPREPHQVDCCGTHFCRQCIEIVQERGKPCPHCKEHGFVTTLDKSVQRYLGTLQVYCTHMNRKHGCNWTGELRKLDEHLNANPALEKKLDGCKYQPVLCTHRCGNLLQRCLLTKHLSSCSYRPATCPHCKQYESTYDDVANEHSNECKSYPVPCPNHCEVSSIQRQHLLEHLSKECSLQVINCEFQYAGCTMATPRQDMGSHLQENLSQHVSQLSHCHSALALKVDQQTKEMKKQVSVQLKGLVAVEGDVRAVSSQVNMLTDSQELSDDSHRRSLLATQRLLQRQIWKAQQLGVLLMLLLVMLLLAIAVFLPILLPASNQQVGENAELRVQVAELGRLVTQSETTISELHHMYARTQEALVELQEKTNGIVDIQQNVAHSIFELNKTHSENSIAVLELQEKLSSRQQAPQALGNGTGSPNQEEQISKLGSDLSAALRKQEEQEMLLHRLDDTVHNPPLDVSHTLVLGNGLHTGNTGELSTCVLVPANVFGALCLSSRLPYCTDFTASDIAAKFTCRSQVDVSTVTPEVSYAAVEMGWNVSLSTYRITYTPEIRGMSRLSIRIKNKAVPDSPFQVFIRHDPKKLGTPVLTITEVVHPWDVAVNRHGELFVTEHTLHRISVIDSKTGSVHQYIGSDNVITLSYPSGIAIDANDDVFVATEQSIVKYSRGGKFLIDLKLQHYLSQKGTHLTIYKDNLYVISSSKVVILVCDVHLIVKYSFQAIEGISIPTDMSFDSVGRMYISDSTNGRFVIFDQNTMDTETLISPVRLSYLRGTNKPHGVAVLRDHVYVSDIATDTITVFTTGGEYVHTFGSSGNGVGEFNQPRGITLDSNGYLYVCDFNNDRVQIF